MLDAVLINPCIFKRDQNIWKSIDGCFPSLGLASIAGYIRSKGQKVQIIDAPALHLSVESFKKFLLDNQEKYQSKIFGFTAVTPSVKNALAMAKIVKEVYPDSKIVFGGVHPTVLPEEIIQQPQVDIVVKGEGEITFYEILKGVGLERIDGIVYQKDDQIITNPARQRILNLDGLPFMPYDLLPMDKYYPARGSYERLPAMSMITSRGCPGRCTFCHKTLGNRIVFRSGESLVEEILLLKKEYGIKQIQFYDDTFTINKDNIKNFCQELIKKKANISWCCFARVDFVDQELLQLMKKSGCHQVMYGFESGDQQVLNSINKKTNLEAAKRVTKWTKQAGIDIRGAFMIGCPIETRETILKTLDFAIELNPEIALFNVATPFPGTAMFEQAKSKNLILSYDWDHYDMSKPIMRLENLSQTELDNLYKHCYKKYYFRPKYILMRIKRLFLNPKEILIMLGGLRSVLSFMRS